MYLQIDKDIGDLETELKNKNKAEVEKLIETLMKKYQKKKRRNKCDFIRDNDVVRTL
jgi:ribosomal protein L17